SVHAHSSAVPSASLCSSCLVFFLCCHGHHRALHSFPTRRSSDLFLLTLYIMIGIAVVVSAILVYTLVRFRERGQAAAGAAGTARSEEHTSELQSRENLVCRLLLEKKKKKKTVNAKTRKDEDTTRD